MRIIIHSLRFPPSVGGLENIMAGLADTWTKAGHDVIVFTTSAGPENGSAYQIVRQYSISKLRHAIRQSDIFVEANVSLKTFWLGLLNVKKWFVIHHAQYRFTWDWKDFVKSLIVVFPKNIAVSHFVASTLFGKSLVIHNFFDLKFRRIPDVVKNKQLIFVGRLVSDKGVSDLIDAIVLLKQRGIEVSCSIVGDGAERRYLEEKVLAQKISSLVSFFGILKDEALVKEINSHQVMVIPSRWEEPFGVVALEGQACGCRIVCSSGGGLREATGDLALCYPNGDVEALSRAIQKSLWLTNDVSNEENVRKHLSMHTPTVIGQQYIDYFRTFLN